MKKKTFLLLLLLAIVGATTFTSCTKEDGVATEDSMNVVDSFLTRSSEQVVHFNIGYGVENNVVFDVYAENPYEITEFCDRFFNVCLDDIRHENIGD